MAMRLGFNFVDADSFYWKPTVPPFKEKYDPGWFFRFGFGQITYIKIGA